MGSPVGECVEKLIDVGECHASELTNMQLSLSAMLGHACSCRLTHDHVMLELSICYV